MTKAVVASDWYTELQFVIILKMAYVGH